MRVFAGKSICEGIAIGKLAVYKKKAAEAVCTRVTDTQAEVKRFIEAKEQAKRELSSLCERAAAEIGKEEAKIFEVYQMVLDDLDYTESITDMILTQGVNAEYAAAATGDKFSAMFTAMDDSYMRGRTADVRDISNRIISILQGKPCSETIGEEPVILLADDLTPSEIVQLDTSRVLSFVAREGSTNSHTAILARTRNIPALTDVDFYANGRQMASREEREALKEEDAVMLDGAFGIVDGYTGRLYVNPDIKTLAAYREKLAADEQKRSLLLELKGKENVTLDGTRIHVYANIDSVSDVEQVLVNDAEGIGLFRSEFLYLESEHYPTEEAQFAAYKTVAEKLAGRRVIIRTLDIGADKQVDYFHLEKEENPAMGYRAIRICLDKKELFKTQLRAIYRASSYGNISILFPMIISVDEVKQIKEIIVEVTQELSAEGIPYKACELGVMLETPAAVLISDLLAKEVDFFSVGTNDLTQYTLAIDRQNPKLGNIYDAHHPAMLRMLRMAAKNGHKEGCRVSICGELAADLALTEQLIRMGFDELSVPPSMILPLRERIRNIDLGM